MLKICSYDVRLLVNSLAMRKKFFIIFLLFMLVHTPAWGEEVSVLLTVDKTTVAMGEVISAQVIVKGARQTISPELLNLNDFEVSPLGRSNQVRIINGVVDSETIFSFRFLPKRPGEFVIGPAVTTVSGNTFRSAQVKINVQSGPPQATGTPPTGTPQTQTPTQAPVPTTEKRNFYITATVDNPRPYVGEQIVYTFKLFNRAQLAHAEMTLPDFAGFLKEDIGKQKSYEEVINGIKWHVAEIRYALFPLLGGEMTIPPAKLIADVVVSNPRDRFFPFLGANRTEKVTISSQSISLLVSRPPSVGKPEEFSGLVGHVTLESAISKRTVHTGESTTLTLTIKGDADLRDFQWVMPKQTDFKVYDDKPTFKILSQEHRIIGSKILKKALVPLKGGELEIPKIAIAYFDPKEKAYRFAEAKAIRLNVSGEGTETTEIVTGATAQKKEVAILGRDLMPIKQGLDALTNDTLPPKTKRGILITLLGSLLLYGILMAFKRWRDRLSGDPAYMRREKAYRRFQVSAKSINQEDAFFATASRLLRTYLGDRFNIDYGALTSADTDLKLRPLGVPKEIIEKIEAFLKTCEEAQYGGRTNGTIDVSMGVLSGLVVEIEKGKSL